jgi:hypothetical protein
MSFMPASTMNRRKRNVNRFLKGRSQGISAGAIPSDGQILEVLFRDGGAIEYAANHLTPALSPTLWRRGRTYCTFEQGEQSCVRWFFVPRQARVTEI